MIRRNVKAGLVGCLLLLGGVSLLASSSTTPPGNEIPGSPGMGAERILGNGNTESEFMILRNGQYHKVKVKSQVVELTESNGRKTTVERPNLGDTAAIEAQLPAENPRLRDVVTARAAHAQGLVTAAEAAQAEVTEAEVTAARAAVGVTGKPAEDQRPPSERPQPHDRNHIGPVTDRIPARP